MADRPGSSPYEVLGVDRAASAKDIKDAYRRAARDSHPDRGGDAARFHSITVAYEILSTPSRRKKYDDERPGATGPEPQPRQGSSGTGPTAAGGKPSAREVPDPPQYVPAFSPTHPPVVPLALAGQQSHGAPRRPGLLSRLSSTGRSQLDGERRTTALLERSLLTSLPSARLVAGVEFSRPPISIGHALVAGYRMAVIDSLAAAPGNFHWDGSRLRHQGRTMPELSLPAAVSALQELFPECNVRGWLILHGSPENPFDPVIDTPPGVSGSETALVQVVNAGSAVRTLGSFLRGGPQPHVIQLEVLKRLLAAATG